MHSPPPFSARLHSGYTETAGGHLCYSETSSWGLRLFVAFIGASLDYKNEERLPVEMPAIPDNPANGVEYALEDAPARG